MAVAAVDPRDGRGAGAPPTHTHRPGHMPRILIADDEAPIAMALRKALEMSQDDVEIDVALNGPDAHQKLLEKDYDVAKEAVERGVEADLIIITGKPSAEAAIAALGIQIEEFITKPFRYDRILATVEEVLARRAA